MLHPSPFSFFQTIISFDFFASVKKTLMETPTEKLYTALKSENSDSEEDYYEVKKAPMMQLLPGTRPLNSAIGMKAFEGKRRGI